MCFSSRYPSTFLPLKLAKFDPVFIDRPLSIRVERCQPIQRVEVGLQFDCPNAGCAIAIGVLIMRWLQVSIEFGPCVAESRPISFGRLRLSSRNRGDVFARTLERL